MRSASVLLLLAGLGSNASAREVWVKASALKPTQMEVGKQAVKLRAGRWEADAKARGMTLREYAEKVIEPTYKDRATPAIIDPAGNVRNTDGHHHVGALDIITRKTGYEFKVKTKIVADYRGESLHDYAEDFVNKRGLGEFTPSIEKLPVDQRVTHLPDSYRGLRDNPMRSALEEIFAANHIKEGVAMKDYAEFRVGRELVDHGVLDKLHQKGLLTKDEHELPNRLVTNPKAVRQIEKKLVKPKMRKALLAEAVSPNDRHALKKNIAEMKDSLKKK